MVRSGEYARLGVYALEAYGIFKVRFSPFFALCILIGDDLVSPCRLGRLSVVGHLWVITCSRAAETTRRRTWTLGSLRAVASHWHVFLPRSSLQLDNRIYFRKKKFPYS